MALKNYADVQAALNNFVNVAGVTPGQAPHGAFWNSMDYTEFTTGNIPGVRQAMENPGGWQLSKFKYHSNFERCWRRLQ